MASNYYRVTDWRTHAESLGHAVGLVVGAFLLGIIIQSAAAFGFAGAGLIPPEALANPDVTIPTVPYAALTASQFVGIFGAGALYVWWRDEPLFEVGLPSLRSIGLIVVGFVALYGVNVGIGVLFTLLDLEVAANQVIEAGKQEPVRFLLMIPVTVLFVAPAEEVVFRGVVQGLFRKAYGVVPGVVLASALFGVGHWLALAGTGGGKLAYVAIAAALGLVLGTLYELSDNLTVPIAVHGLYNTLLFVGQYLIATGTIPN